MYDRYIPIDYLNERLPVRFIMHNPLNTNREDVLRLCKLNDVYDWLPTCVKISPVFFSLSKKKGIVWCHITTLDCLSSNHQLITKLITLTGWTS
jgi:hypothetical protein